MVSGEPLEVLRISTRKLARTYMRSALLRVLEQRKLLTQLTMGSNGAFDLKLNTWPEYWGPSLIHNTQEARQRLGALRRAWTEYIGSGFDAMWQRQYCYTYFSLLDALLKEVEARPGCANRQAALGRALAFECFGLTSSHTAKRDLAAGTSTLRNPCYLLTKLKWPRAIDDPQFLPLITVVAHGSPSLFYHYRQHRLSIDSGNSVLLYLCARHRARRESFRVVNAFASFVGPGTDPRASERAGRITQQIIVPYL